jgi:WD40 repeat protein
MDVGPSWSEDHALRLWDFDSGVPRAFEERSTGVQGALLMPDGRHALSWSEDHILRLWDLNSGSAQSFERDADA